MARRQILGVLGNLLFGIAVCGVALGALEVGARLLPQSVLPGDVASPQRLAPPDRGSDLIRANGYRGARPCKSCPADNLRIVTMGGSSTYGVPMQYSTKTYSAILQRLVKERLGSNHIEVLNGGIAGFGIWQILETYENVVRFDKPDVLVICAWFNDSSAGLGWYGMEGRSDEDAYEEVTRLRAIERNPLYRIIARSRLYHLVRALVLKARAAPVQSEGKKKRPPSKRRSSPDEFRRGLERVVEAAERDRVQVVLLFEALNRTRSRAETVPDNKYYQIIEAVAAEHDIPVVDTLTPLAERPDEWLFYDFIHPNEHGHAVIAEALYASLFDTATSSPRLRALFESKGIAGELR